MPKEKQSGHVLQTKHDFMVFFGVFLVSLAGFFTLYFLCHKLFVVYKFETFTSKSANERDCYIQCITSSAEKLSVASIALYNLWTYTSP